jgi:hypothetical protein
VPPPQRDAIELAAWLGCSIIDIARLRPGDVRNDGLRLRRKFTSWPSDFPPRLRQSVIELASATASNMRVYEAHKPSFRAARDLRAAALKAPRIAAETMKRAARRIDARSPDFIVLGVPRSATTWLYYALASHPDIYLPKVKEQEFFGDYRFHLGWNWYLNHFVNRGNQAIAGDISVGYFHSSEAPAQIASLLPAETVKLIVILREPIERARSYYNYRLIRGMIPASFEDAIAIPYFRDLFVTQGHYARYLDHWYKTFDPIRLLVLLYEDIETDSASVLTKVARFLGVSAQGFVVPARNNCGADIAAVQLHRMLLHAAANIDVALPGRYQKIGQILGRTMRALDLKLFIGGHSPYRVPLAAQTEHRLQHEFAPSNDRLARMTGLDLSGWRYSRL